MLSCFISILDRVDLNLYGSWIWKLDSNDPSRVVEWYKFYIIAYIGFIENL